ncbi:hypothetical protein [Streptomyces sp. NPDC049906]|uniref:hypothetical protein n=1 Tax=Streptomyces sp. NPDC049906 TaxID=3155656 RepID=UPI00342DC9C6
MSFLMRAPEDVASWDWDLEGVVPAGLRPSLETAAQMANVLADYDLLEARYLEWDWFVPEKGSVGVWTRLSLQSEKMDASDLVQRIAQCRPSGFVTAKVSDILITGYGTWFDGEGRPHRERGLVELLVTPEELGPSAQLAVHHDIWGEYDFRGRPHPEVHRRNAPRLTAALGALDNLLGVSCEPGPPTYFGSAEGHGVAGPDLLIDGLALDVTDRL